jgi:hypothetical protein
VKNWFHFFFFSKWVNLCCYVTVMDADRDGLVGVDELLRFELFASYGQTVVERVHAHFEYTSGFHGRALHVESC